MPSETGNAAADADVSIVLPARHAAATLTAAVRSAAAQRPRPARVVIAADPADVPTWQLARALARSPDDAIRVVANPGGATAAGLNQAIAATDTAVVARLDAHSIAPPDYLARATAVLQRTGAAVVGGRQSGVGHDPISRAISAAMASPVGSGAARHRIGGPPGPVETAYLGVFRRDWIDRVGGFDEQLARNQDYEICQRLRQAGGAVWFDPSLCVNYQPRANWRDLAAQYHDYGRWKRLVMRRHPRSIRLRQVAAPALVVALSASAVAALLPVGSRRTSRRVAAVVPAAWSATLIAGAVGAAPPRPCGSAAHAVVPLSVADRARVVVALAIMHLAWGAGVLRGGAARMR